MSNAPAFLYQSVLSGWPNEVNGSRFTFPSPTPIIVGDAGTATECDSVGICMPSADGFLYVYSGLTGSGPWTLRCTAPAYKNRNSLTFFDSAATAQYWYVQSTFASVSVIKVGKAVRMDQNNYQGVSPPGYNQSVSLKPAGLMKGQWLGRQSYGRTASASYSFDHTTSAWWRANAVDLVEALRNGKGAFYAWRPDKYPQDVLYGHLSGPVNISNTGTKSFVGGSIQISGVYDGNFDALADYSVTVPS
jgi:hypothetical protein